MLDEELSLADDVTDKLYRCKTKIRRMREMQKLGVGFGMVEKFLENLSQQKKVEKAQGYRETKISKEIMEVKIKERKLHNLLKARHQEIMKKITSKTGRGTRKHQSIRKHLNWVGKNARDSIDKKYDRKIAHLRQKHQTDVRKET